MTNAEKQCTILIAKGKWTRALCQLCRRINPVKCSIAVKQNNSLQNKKKGI
jgi:hypothetical protein